MAMPPVPTLLPSVLKKKEKEIQRHKNIRKSKVDRANQTLLLLGKFALESDKDQAKINAIIKTLAGSSKSFFTAERQFLRHDKSTEANYVLDVINSQ